MLCATQFNIDLGGAGVVVAMGESDIQRAFLFPGPERLLLLPRRVPKAPLLFVGYRPQGCSHGCAGGIEIEGARERENNEYVFASALSRARSFLRHWLKLLPSCLSAGVEVYTEDGEAPLRGRVG